MKKTKIFRFYKANFSLFFFISLLFCSLSINQGFTNTQSNQSHKSIEEIDQEIKELEDMKRGYESKALKHDNQAELFQFKEGELQRAKRHWKLAEDNRKIARRIQMQIDELKIQRIALLKKKG